MRASRIDERERGRDAPAEVLAEVAEESDAGLIVVVARRRPALRPLGGLPPARPPHPLRPAPRERSPTRTRTAYERVDRDRRLGDRRSRRSQGLRPRRRPQAQRRTSLFVGHPRHGRADHAGHGRHVRRRGRARRCTSARATRASEILAAATGAGADLLVVGNKGMTGARGFLLGSVPEKVIEQRRSRRAALPHRSCSWSTELVPGEGGIIERQGEKLAAYMDADGELHLLSARCTHMGCTVAWNPGERDLRLPVPRLAVPPGGEVVNGPAARPLPPA